MGRRLGCCWWAMLLTGAWGAAEPYRVSRQPFGRPMPGEGCRTQLALSPDGRRLACIEGEAWCGGQTPANRPLVVLDRQGREVLRREGDFGLPSWSPHGKRLAFCDLAGQLYTMRPDGSDCAVRARGLAARLWTPPAWSPSGRWLVYLRDQDRSVWICEPDGAHARLVLGPTRHGREYRWAAGTDLLICVDTPGNSPGERRVWLVSPGGRVSVPRSPTRRAQLVDIDPSPDGRRCAYLVWDRQEQVMSVWLRAANGTARELTRAGADDGAVRWSPDGQRLTAELASGCCSDLALWTAAGRAVCRPFEGGLRAWSPGGKRLAFVRSHQDELWVCDNAGRRRTRVAPTDAIGGSAFTPNGMALLVSRRERLERVELRR